MASHLLVAMAHESNQLELLVSETGQLGSTFHHKANVTDTFNELFSIVSADWYSCSLGTGLGQTIHYN